LLDDAFLRRLEGLRLKARRLSGAPGGARAGRQRTPTADFVDHRPYSPGDDMRHVDWHALARLDEVHVKVGQRPQATSVEIVLDRSRSMGVPPGKWVLAVRIAAALGWLSLAAGDRVTLRGFPGSPSLWGPMAGLGAAQGLLAALSGLERESGQSDAATALSAVGRLGRSGGVAVIVSDFWLAGDPQRALASLPAPRWDVLALHLLDPAELDPTLSGSLELEDAEGGDPLYVDVDDDVRAAYRAEVRARVEGIRRLVGRRGGDHALILSSWPLERAVLPFLRRQGLLGD
jgi:uncharacterized protein (DUF58 family)